MSKRTKFLVTYGEHTARFSAYADAMFFAREVSRWDGPIGSHHTVEVRNASGLIAQFIDGKATEEFAHIDKAARADGIHAMHMAEFPA